LNFSTIGSGYFTNCTIEIVKGPAYQITSSSTFPTYHSVSQLDLQSVVVKFIDSANGSVSYNGTVSAMISEPPGVSLNGTTSLTTVSRLNQTFTNLFLDDPYAGYYTLLFYADPALVNTSIDFTVIPGM
jgi:hypothetical protein